MKRLLLAFTAPLFLVLGACTSTGGSSGSSTGSPVFSNPSPFQMQDSVERMHRDLINNSSF